MFVDASAIVAILSKEPDADDLSERIEQAECLTSPVVILEAVMTLSTKLDIDPLSAEAAVQELLKQSRISLVPLTQADAHLAVEAFRTYGKGRGHPAKLNLGDGLSYACAKARDVGLLYKDNDFARPDLA